MFGLFAKHIKRASRSSGLLASSISITVYQTVVMA
jgi:hypothetical protein